MAICRAAADEAELPVRSGATLARAIDVTGADAPKRNTSAPQASSI